MRSNLHIRLSHADSDITAREHHASGIRIIRVLNWSFFFTLSHLQCPAFWPQFNWIDETAAQMALLSIILSIKLILRCSPMPTLTIYDGIRWNAFLSTCSHWPGKFVILFSAFSAVHRFPDRLLWIILCLSCSLFSTCYVPPGLWEAV